MTLSMLGVVVGLENREALGGEVVGRLGVGVGVGVKMVGVKKGRDDQRWGKEGPTW